MESVSPTKRTVDLIADDIRSILIDMAPRYPNEAEYQQIAEFVAQKYLHRVVDHGVDIDGQKFIEIEALN